MESRISAGRKQQKRGGYPPVIGQPVIHRFDPARAAACAQVNVPYGQVYVGGCVSSVRSHELRLDSKDRSCFISPDQLTVERMKRQADAAWFGAQSAQSAQSAENASAGTAA